MRADYSKVRAAEYERKPCRDRALVAIDEECRHSGSQGSVMMFTKRRWAFQRFTASSPPPLSFEAVS